MPVRSLFATPIAMFDLTDLNEVNRDLTERLVAESKSIRSLARSNVGGWHSKTDLHTRSEKCYRTLIGRIVDCVRDASEEIARELGRPLPAMTFNTHAWAMVMRDGDYTIPHDHAEVHWATVYYPDAGDADESAHPDSGLLALVDPRHGGRPIPGLDLVGGTFLARPATGRLLIFPGWLLHYVHTYRGRRPRVAISCNLNFELTRPAG